MSVVDSIRRRIRVPQPQPPSFDAAAPRRVMLYCAGNVGMGHLLRLVRVARRLRALRPGTNFLLVTDRPDIPADEAGVAEFASLRLPGSRFVDDTFREEPIALDMKRSELREMRSGLILEAARQFQPHALLADTAPHGKQNEILPLLRALAAMRKPPYRILQMRDIPFPPGEDFRWKRDPALALRESRLYDRIFVAGDARFFDLAKEYGWPADLAARIEYAGFFRDSPNGHTVVPDPNKIVASFGGGWEVAPLARRVIDAFARLRASRPALALDLFTGPAVTADEWRELNALGESAGAVRLEKFAPDFPRRLAACALAFVQAGSTPFQILDGSIPMIIYHRDYSNGEQACRAERLARCGPGIAVIDREWLSTGDLTSLMRQLLSAPPVPRATGFSFAGADTVAQAVHSALGH